MRKFWLLLKTNLWLTFNPKRLFSQSNKPASKGKIVLYAFLMLYLFANIIALSFGFYYMLGVTLYYAHLTELLIYLSLTLYTVLILVLSLFSASGYLFKSKDLQLMLSLPVSHFTVLMVKFFLQYVYELIFAVFVVAPAFYYYFFFTSYSLPGVIFAVVCFFAAPLIPMSIGSLLSYFIGLLTRKLRRKNLFSILFSLLFFFGWMFFIQNREGIITYVQEHGPQLKDAIAKYYLPADWLISALNGGFFGFLLFIAVNLAVTFLIFAIVSKKYAEIIAILNSSGVRKKTKLGRLDSQNSSALGAMIKKELSMYFNSAIYVLNTLIGSILLLVASISFMFVNLDVFLPAAGEDFGQIGLAVVAGILSFMPSISPTTSSVISLEGKRLWLYKSLPVQTKDILKAKTAVNIIVNAPFVFVADVLFCIKFGLSVFDYLLLAALAVSFIVLFSLTGIMINLAKPKLDFDNEVIVIKQSASAMFQTFLSMGVVFAVFLIYALSGVGNFYLFALSILIVVLAVAALLTYKLFTWGVEKFNQLNA
ncbi:MAG TPA: hypothetical protein PKV51_09950 [Bacillota bacterium]|nr:hypothetical protein [Bacillota bacterium]